MYAAREGAKVILFRAIRARAEKLQALQSLHDVGETLAEAGIATTSLIGRGSPAESIVQAARSEVCGLIAMTTRGGSPVKRWWIGGETEKVIRLSKLPVLVARASFPPIRQAAIRTITVPLDGSEFSEKAIPPAIELARLHEAQVRLLHVRGSRKAPPLGAMVRHLERLELQARPMVVEGDPALEITRRCFGPFSLIVMSSHGRGRVAHWLLGSVAEKVIHHATCPILVVK